MTTSAATFFDLIYVHRNLRL